MKKVRKDFIAFLLGLILIINPSMNCYSFETLGVETEKASQLKDEVYLTDGQGSTIQGDGTSKNPYQNIKTALNNVKPGGTIKITGKFSYWKYEETSDLLNRPLIIDKEVTIMGAESNNEFLVRAPIQLGADVTFKNLNMQFWASNELMPGVPDSGLPQTPVDEGTKFRSGRTIYLAGYKLTLDAIDTSINTESHQRDYRPYISAGTFRDEVKTGHKAILEVKNTVLGTGVVTQFAGIYAGDYWVDRNYPVEFNIKGRVLDKTIHTGGIMVPSKSDVVINLSNGTGVTTINTDKHDGSATVNIKDGANLSNANFGKITNLNIESGSMIELAKDSKFEVENLTLKNNSLLDLREISGDAKVNGNFTGETNDSLKGGSIYLANGKTLDISGDVEGKTLLNRFRNEVIPLEGDKLYIKAKSEAKGEFIIEPATNQSHYQLIKNTNDDGYTTWKTIKTKEYFKNFRWTDVQDEILEPSDIEEYMFYYEIINEEDEVYLPVGDDWDDISVTLIREDNSVLDLDNNFDGDIFIGSYLDEYDKPFISLSFSQQFIAKNQPEELTLKISHKDGVSISKKIYVGKEKPPTTIVDVANVASKYNLQRGQDGYEDIYDLNYDGIIDIFDIVSMSKSMNN